MSLVHNRCSPLVLALFVATAIVAGAACAEAPAFTGHAPAEGTDLHFHSYGDGAPLLVLNGGPGVSSEHFGDLGRRLAAQGPGYRTVLFDQRGTGRSTLERVDESSVNLAVMIEDIEALRTHLGIERWAVFGHSWGGMYAMLYATAHPDRVEGLVLSASGGVNLDWLQYVGANIRMRLGPERRAEYERWGDPANAARDPEAANRHRVAAMAAAYVYDPDNIPFVVEALTRPNANFPEVRGEVYADLERTGYDLRPALAGFGRPALILARRQDILGEQVPLAIDAAIPDSKLVWLDECSHYPWLDAPEPYFAAIETFLGGLGGTAVAAMP